MLSNMPEDWAYLTTFTTIYQGSINMKNKLLAFIVLITFCLTIISGCKPNPEPGFEAVSDSSYSTVSGLKAGFDFAPVSEIRENFPKLTKELRELEFDNLNFSKTEFSFPEIDSISELSSNLFSVNSAQEIYDFFSVSIDTLMPGKFSDGQKLNEIRFYDVETPDNNPVDSFPTIDDYKLTEYPWPFFKTDECYMDMRFGVVRWFDNGDLKRWCGKEGSPVMETIFEYGNSIAFITDLNCTDEYELTNGRISVKDAAEFVNNYLATADLSLHELPARSKAVAVNVVDIGNGKYGYNFIITPEYKNVLFDHFDMNGGQGLRLVQNDYDKRSYGVMPGQIGMIETDKIFQLISPAYAHVLEEKETYTSIITLENAAEIVSDFYSGNMAFFVTNVSAVYLPSNTIEPCWKFIMSYNGEQYHTFVNMHTGEVHVYIQG